MSGIEAPALPDGLDTPALVIDLDVVERNGRRLGGALAERGIALRPHVKTHKSVALARIQVDAGAAGLTVGTLGEAEVMAAAGFSDLFLAYPLWAEGSKAGRLTIARISPLRGSAKAIAPRPLGIRSACVSAIFWTSRSIVV